MKKKKVDLLQGPFVFGVEGEGDGAGDEAVGAGVAVDDMEGVWLPSPVASLRTSPSCLRSWPSVGEMWGWLSAFLEVEGAREVRGEKTNKNIRDLT